MKGGVSTAAQGGSKINNVELLSGLPRLSRFDLHWSLCNSVLHAAESVEAVRHRLVRIPLQAPLIHPINSGRYAHSNLLSFVLTST